jgi:hypothetical protein
MRAVGLGLVLAGCTFAPGSPWSPVGGGDGGAFDDGGGSDGTTPVQPDGPVGDGDTCWGYVSTNFDNCMLPGSLPAVTVNGTETIVLSVTSLPKQTLTQSDGSEVTVIYLGGLTVNAPLTINGNTPVIFAVDGDVVLNAEVRTNAGRDLAAHCAGAFGANGSNSTNGSSGGGGGGGGAAADDGGDGGDGDGDQKGAKGAKGTKIGPSTLSPLRGGCRGGNGGDRNGSGTPGVGGTGGGAIQIGARGSITINSSGRIDAKGLGGTAATSQTGGGGGGAGGGIFLEANQVTIHSAGGLCADGGAGAEGGGSSITGAPGGLSPCTGVLRAATLDLSSGGNGGSGGYRPDENGLAALPGNGGSSAGGGGGGGAAGWIRIRSIMAPSINVTAAITPAPDLN